MTLQAAFDQFVQPSQDSLPGSVFLQTSGDQGGRDGQHQDGF